MPNSVVRFTPYGGGSGSFFSAANARRAIKAGRYVGGKVNSYLAGRNPTERTVPLTAKSKTRTVKKANGGYKRVRKNVIASKVARKAIAEVVKTELNKEIELKYAPVTYTGTQLSHRVCYVRDLTAGLVHGDGINAFTADKIHLTSVNLKGVIHEVMNASTRGLKSQVEFYIVAKRGGFTNTSSMTTFNGPHWFNVPESQIVKSDQDADNSTSGRFAPISPTENGFRILSKKTVVSPINRGKPIFGTVDLPADQRLFDFRMKVDKSVKPDIVTTIEQDVDEVKYYLLMRAMFPSKFYTYGQFTAGNLEFDTKIYFRDG